MGGRFSKILPVDSSVSRRFLTWLLKIGRSFTQFTSDMSQRLNHTASNREHIWRLLQGGELIAPVPPLPPRETPDTQPETGTVKTTQPGEKAEDGPSAPEPHNEAVPPPPVKKTRTRKKAEVASGGAAEPRILVQAELGETPPVTPLKRSRKKKTVDEAGSPVETKITIPSRYTGSASQASTDASAGSKPPKPKPKRYPVGEQETEQGNEEKEHLWPSCA